MKYKFMVDRSRLPSPVMSVEVWETDYCALPLERFPYNPAWWNQHKDERLLGYNMPISGTFKDALNIAKDFYDSLQLQPAPRERVLIGRIDHLKDF